MIKIDMRMPKSCFECPMFNIGDQYSQCLVTQHITGYASTYANKRMEDCPLSEEETKAE